MIKYTVHMEKGVQDLKNKESKSVASTTDKHRLVPLTGKEEEILPINDEWGWYDLHTPYSEEEGVAMGHCGNKPYLVDGDTILSLRRKVSVDGRTYHQPHLTFIENNGYLGEMKGKYNSKPSEKYHDEIVKLLEHPKIKGVIGGGHLHYNNFSINDLKDEHKQRILAKKPNIDFWTNPDGHEVGEKFEQEKEAAKWFKDIKSKYGNDWKKGFIENLKTAPDLALSNLHDINNHQDIIKHILVNHENVTSNSEILVHAGVLAMTDENKDLAASHRNDDIVIGYTSSPNLHKRHYKQLLKHRNASVVENIIRSKYFQKEDMDYVLNHDDWMVRTVAVESDYFGSEYMEKALKDKDAAIVMAAIKSKCFGKQYMDFVLNHSDWTVREAATLSEHFGSEHMEKALKDKHYSVVLSAMKSKHFGTSKSHFDMTLNHHDEEVRNAAKNHPNYHLYVEGKLK